MKQIDYAGLEPETRAMLEAIRDDPEPIRARSLRQPQFRRLVAELAKPYLNDAGLVMVPYCNHLGFCNAVSGVLRKWTGTVLFHELVAQLLRWIGYGLAEETLAGVLNACYQGLKQWKEPVDATPQAPPSSP